MHHFTPGSALLGGLLIGLSATLLWWLNGRIAGISGILGNALSSEPGAAWRFVFLISLVVGAGATAALTGGPGQHLRSGFSVPLLILAGLLTGYGTSLANGCTSGHGVCGLGRLSLRSLVSTAVFLGLAIVTTYLTRHVAGVVA
jgi:uncharacterized membrane protein YedE/YeeE